MPLLSFLNDIKDPHTFSPSTSIPPLSAQTIIVTGGNAGIGLETVVELAQHAPARLYLAARSQAKYDAALAEVRTRLAAAGKEAAEADRIAWLELDLASLASVKAAAEKVLAENNALHVLINNGGIMAAPRGTPANGYEVHFGVNHMGHALLTRLLLPLLLRTAEHSAAAGTVRVLNVTSSAMSGGRASFVGDALRTDGGGTNSYRLYMDSKLANVLQSRQLAKLYPSIISAAINPGRVATGLLADSKAGLVMDTVQSVYDTLAGVLTPEQGALNSLWAATAPSEQIENGAMYDPVGAKNNGTAASKDDKLADKLWAWQEDEFKRLGY